MLKKTALIVSAALALSLPATAALAADDVDDQTVTTTTCDQSQDRAQLRNGTATGDCVYGDEAVQDRTMTRQRDQVYSPEDCTGDGPQVRAANAGNAAGQGNGLGIGDGPQARSANATGNQFGRAGS